MNEMGGTCSRYWGVEAYTGFYWGNWREEDHLGDLGVDERIILDGSSRSGKWGYGLERAGSEQRHVAGTCACCNELSGSIKCGEFLD
jgi:hypothetical protein